MHLQVCSSKTFVAEDEQFGNCWGPSEDVESPASISNPTCAHKEFYYDACSGPTVTLDLK